MRRVTAGIRIAMVVLALGAAGWAALDRQWWVMGVALGCAALDSYWLLRARKRRPLVIGVKYGQG